MTMDGDKLEKLNELLRNGDLDQDTYDEIVKRWENEGGNPVKEQASSEERATGRERSKRVNVSGAGRLSDVYTHEFNGSGSVHVEGFLDADDIDISGAGRVEGDLISSQSVDISGSANISGNVNANSLESSGSLRAASIKCRDLESSGSLKVENGIEADTIESSGGVHAETITANVIKASGSLNADSVKAEEIYVSGKVRSSTVICKRFEMELFGSSSRIKNLEAEIIEIRQGRRLFSGNAEVVEIKCKRAQLEGVISKKVTGDELIIGSGCDIDYVEGHNIKVLEGARVREKKEI